MWAGLVFLFVSPEAHMFCFNSLMLVDGFSLILATQTIEKKRCQLCCHVQLHSVWVIWRYVFLCSLICGCKHETECVCVCMHTGLEYLYTSRGQHFLSFFQQKNLTGLRSHEVAALSQLPLTRHWTKRGLVGPLIALQPSTPRDLEEGRQRVSSERMGGYIWQF